MIDAVWTPIAEAVLNPVLGEAAADEFASIDRARQRAELAAAPPSAAGWYGYVYKDLRAELGDSVARARTAASTAATAASKPAGTRCGRRSRPRPKNCRPKTKGRADEDLASREGPDRIPAAGPQKIQQENEQTRTGDDELDEPFDLPAGDRIHRSRRWNDAIAPEWGRERRAEGPRSGGDAALRSFKRLKRTGGRADTTAVSDEHSPLPYLNEPERRAARTRRGGCSAPGNPRFQRSLEETGAEATARMACVNALRIYAVCLFVLGVLARTAGVRVLALGALRRRRGGDGVVVLVPVHGRRARTRAQAQPRRTGGLAGTRARGARRAAAQAGPRGRGRRPRDLSRGAGRSGAPSLLAPRRLWRWAPGRSGRSAAGSRTRTWPPRWRSCWR